MVSNPHQPSEVVGLRIREVRNALGISQRELARRVGIDHSRLSRLEHGDTLGAVDLLMALAAALEVSPAYLLAPGDSTSTMRAGGLLLDADSARQWMRGGLLPGVDPRATFAALTQAEREAIALESLTPETTPLARAAVPLDEKARRQEQAEDLAWEATDGERIRGRQKKGDTDAS